jgi:hypothetical protein
MGLDQMKDTEASAPKQRFGQRRAENNHCNGNKGRFAGVACQYTTFEPRSLVNSPLTSIDAFESEGETAFTGMAMAVQLEQKPTAEYNYRIMTA